MTKMILAGAQEQVEKPPWQRRVLRWAARAPGTECAVYLGARAFEPQQLGQVIPRRVVDCVLKHLDLLHQGQVIVVRSHLHQNIIVLREQPRPTVWTREGTGWLLVQAELGSNFTSTAKRREEITLQKEERSGCSNLMTIGAARAYGWDGPRHSTRLLAWMSALEGSRLWVTGNSLCFHSHMY